MHIGVAPMQSGFMLWPRSVMSRAFLLLLGSLLFGSWAYAEIVNIKLNGPLAGGEDVSGFKFTSESTRVVFRAGIVSAPPSDRYNLFSAPIDGTSVVQLNPFLPGSSSVQQDYSISSDDSLVVYRAAQDEAGKVELYSVPIDGPAGSAVKLNRNLLPEEDVYGSESGYGFLVSPDGSRVVYAVKRETSSLLALYSVPLTGPADAAVQLNDPVQIWGVREDSFWISPDSQRVVYWGDIDSHNAGVFSVPLEGPASATIQLSRHLTPGSSVLGGTVQISPDSSRVIYIADQQVNNVNELYSVPIGGPAIQGVKLNGTLPTDGNVDEFFISPDSQWVVYAADQETQGDLDLFSVPIEGALGGGVRINRATPATFKLHSRYTLISPDSSRVVYLESLGNVSDTAQLFSTPIDGPPTAAVRLNRVLAAGGSVYWHFLIAGGVGRVVYMADQDTDEEVNLYSVPIAGPEGEGVVINRSLGINGDVRWFSVSPDGLHVAYTADRINFFLGNDIFRLWTVPAVGPGVASILHGPPPVDGGDVSNRFEFTPDNSRLVYVADQDTNDVYELYVSYDRPAATRGWIGYR